MNPLRTWVLVMAIYGPLNPISGDALSPAQHRGISAASPTNRQPDSFQILLEDPIVQQATQLLAEALPKDTYYHNLGHTLDVMEQAVLLAERSDLNKRDIQLLAIAAAWHDAGFIQTKHNNEPIAAQMARAAMETNGSFLHSEIADVEAAILDTQLTYEIASGTSVQRAMGRLSPWLLDADLANFGRTDFFEKTLAVYREIQGVEISSLDGLNSERGIAFLANTLRMMSRHDWQTQSAREILDTQKTLNRSSLAVLLANMISGTPESRIKAWQEMSPRGLSEKSL